MDVAVHLVDKQQHRNVHLQPQTLLPTSDTIEAVGIATAEVDGDYVAMILHTLGDECLLPRQVMDTTIDHTGVETRGEHEHVVVALEAGLHHSGEVTALLTRLVDADTHRTKAGKEQQQVVDEITEASVIMVTDDRTETNTVLATQGWLLTKV